MINVIVAYDVITRGIGFEGKLPWDLPSDMRHFYNCTKKQRVLMGVGTIRSIGTSLPTRENFVLTHSVAQTGNALLREGVITYADDIMVISHEDLIRLIGNARGNKDFDIWVIGGEQVYRTMLPHADCVIATEVDVPADELSYDKFFPDLPDQSVWVAEDYPAVLLENAPDMYPFKVVKYTRQPG